MKSVRFVVQHAGLVPPDDDWLGAGERAVAARLRSEPRRCAWRLGRWTAKRVVLRHLGLGVTYPALRAVQILADPGGMPVPWVEGARLPVALSISHRAGAALACVGPTSVALGCDLERDEPRSDSFIRHFLSESERRDLAELPARVRERAATLVWSSKESALKALGQGLRADARDVVVHAAPFDLETHRWQPLLVHPAGGEALDGWWCRRGTWLLTVVAAAPLEEPTALA